MRLTHADLKMADMREDLFLFSGWTSRCQSCNKPLSADYKDIYLASGRVKEYEIKNCSACGDQYISLIRYPRFEDIVDKSKYRIHKLQLDSYEHKNDLGLVREKYEQILERTRAQKEETPTAYTPTIRLQDIIGFDKNPKNDTDLMKEYAIDLKTALDGYSRKTQDVMANFEVHLKHINMGRFWNSDKSKLWVKIHPNEIDLIGSYLMKCGFEKRGPYVICNKYSDRKIIYYRLETDYSTENINLLCDLSKGDISIESIDIAINEIVNNKDMPYILYLCRLIDKEGLKRIKRTSTEQIRGNEILVSGVYLVEKYGFQFQLEWSADKDDIDLYISVDDRRYLINDFNAKCYVVSLLFKDEFYEIQLLKKRYAFWIRNIDQKYHTISSFDFIVRSNVFKCEKSHNLKDINASVDVITRLGMRRKVDFTACYCEVCKKYYILDPVYKDLRKMGVPVCNIIRNEESTFTDRLLDESDFGGLSEESVLHMRGYNVGEKDDLSEIQRHQILEIIVDDHIKTRNGIASFLLSMININRNKKADYTNALDKWENDIRYILRYGIFDDFTEVRNILIKQGTL